jgi:hypothetical protein
MTNGFYSRLDESWGSGQFAESLRVAHDSDALRTNELAWVTVDTTGAAQGSDLPDQRLAAARGGSPRSQSIQCSIRLLNGRLNSDHSELIEYFSILENLGSTTVNGNDTDYAAQITVYAPALIVLRSHRVIANL